MNDPDIALRQIEGERRAHTLYFELAAETGIIGIITFFAPVVLIQTRLWRAWRRWRGRRPDLSGLAGGFFLALAGYFVTAIFLQLAYQRYYWLLLGLAGAALLVLEQEERRFGDNPAAT
jgi:O-antigen ligase